MTYATHAQYVVRCNAIQVTVKSSPRKCHSSASGNFLWYMTDSITVLEGNYSEVAVNVTALVPALLAGVETTQLCNHDDHKHFSRFFILCSCFVM